MGTFLLVFYFQTFFQSFCDQPRMFFWCIQIYPCLSKCLLGQSLNIPMSIHMSAGSIPKYTHIYPHASLANPKIYPHLSICLPAQYQNIPTSINMSAGPMPKRTHVYPHVCWPNPKTYPCLSTCLLGQRSDFQCTAC
jgi:hypothetical protein